MIYPFCFTVVCNFNAQRLSANLKPAVDDDFNPSSNIFNGDGDEEEVEGATGYKPELSDLDKFNKVPFLPILVGDAVRLLEENQSGNYT